MKTYLKTFARMFRRHITRFISIFLMVLISVGFSAGIGMATDKMDAALDGEYRSRNVSDFIVRGESDLSGAVLNLRKLGYEISEGGILELRGGEPFTETQAIETGFVSGTAEIRATFSGLGNADMVRVYFFKTEDDLLHQNTPEILEERTEPLEEGLIPIAVERETSQLRGYRLGDRLTATVGMKVTTSYGVTEEENTFEFVVTRILRNPLHNAVRLDPSMQERADGDGYEELGAIFYLVGCTFPVMGRQTAFPVNSLYLSSPVMKACGKLFGREQETLLEREKAKIEAALRGTEGELGILTLHENFTFESYTSFAEKVEMIGYVLMAVFLAVTLLVVLSTMTRLLEEERAQIACLATLGYSPARILVKYLLFAAAGTLLGAAGGYGASLGLAYIIYVNFNWNYAMPPFPAEVSLAFFLIVASVIFVSTVAATAFAGLKKLSERPAELLRPKAPRPGRKVLLERIPLLWNHISFKYKSTLRNVLRYRMRFAMTVVAVMASTALVLAGLAVLDCCIFQDIGTMAMVVVAIVVLVFAALLNFVVIYTLTNINISERERELATLMVLGYHRKEVSMYVFREIYITGAVGILLGLPFGALLCTFIFDLMELGSLGAINLYVWFVAPVMSIFFTFLVTLMLTGKITRIRMNESLKAIE